MKPPLSSNEATQVKGCSSPGTVYFRQGRKRVPALMVGKRFDESVDFGFACVDVRTCAKSAGANGDDNTMLSLKV